jgi:hypothetical protein
MWHLYDASMFAQTIIPPLREAGWGCALGGSVLEHGWSGHDLDLVVFPRNTNSINRVLLDRVFFDAGMRLVHSVQTVHAGWRKQGSFDQKHVEVWETADGRRVDIFLLS